MTIRVRFAPSPTGFLHIGNIRAALLNWLFARQNDGTFILRLDDTDAARSTEEYAEAIRTDLVWLGLNPDEEYKQSDRFDRYNEVAEQLKQEGRLYPCYETPDELKLKAKMQLARHKPPVYDREGLKLTEEQRDALEAKGRKPHWRFKLSTPKTVIFTDHIRGNVSIDLDSVSDPVLIREDGSYLYSLPSVVDDIDLGISHVVRGEDHVTNSAVQVDIFEALGSKAPDFAHFSLFSAIDGEGLSKRKGSGSIREYRDVLKVEPMAIISLLARLGTSEPVIACTDPSELIKDFSFSKFSRGTVKFDPHELEILNAKILHQTEFEAVAPKVSIDGFDKPFWDAVRQNIKRLDELEEWWKIVHGIVTPASDDAEYLALAHDLFPDDELTNVSWKIWVDAIKEKSGRKGKELFQPLRLALTGQEHGPEMNVLLPLIGAEKAKKRLLGEAS